MTQQFHPCPASSRGEDCPQKYHGKHIDLNAFTGLWHSYARFLHSFLPFYPLSASGDGLLALRPDSIHLMKNHFRV